MSAPASRLLRYGMYAVFTATDELVYGAGDEPDIWGHVVRDGWRATWLITAGRFGPVLRGGRTWTKAGAWVEATVAAHRPGIGKAVAP